MADNTSIGGTQSLKRAFGILRMIADADGSGVRLTDIARSCDLNTATAHRLLRSLVDEGLLVAADDRTYSLGPEIVRMAGRVDLGRVAIARYGSIVEEIAGETEDTVFLSIRHRADAICVMARSGRYHIRTMSLEEGSVRPLGTGAGSLALLSMIDADERDRVVSANASRYEAFGLSAEMVMAMVASAITRGHAVNDGRILEGVWGLGVPLPSPDRSLQVALSVAAIEHRMSEERMAWIVELVRTRLPKTA